MSKHDAFSKALKLSKTRTAYVVWDGEDFGADSCGQGGYQVARDEDFDGFYAGCQIIAEFDRDSIDPFEIQF